MLILKSQDSYLWHLQDMFKQNTRCGMIYFHACSLFMLVMHYHYWLLLTNLFVSSYLKLVSTQLQVLITSKWALQEKFPKDGKKQKIQNRRNIKCCIIYTYCSSFPHFPLLLFSTLLLLLLFSIIASFRHTVPRINN